MPQKRLPHRAWTTSMKLQKNHKSKIICTVWGADIRKGFSRWKVESYLNMPPEKLKLQEFQSSLLCTLRTHWLEAEKRTKLEYYQAEINPLCWSSFMTPEASAQPYINTPIPLLYRRNIARFRTRSHTLAIEKGAWLDMPRHARVCRFCDAQTVETEAHVALYCPKYAHIRDDYQQLLVETTQLSSVLSTASPATLGSFVIGLFFTLSRT